MKPSNWNGAILYSTRPCASRPCDWSNISPDCGASWILGLPSILRYPKLHHSTASLLTWYHTPQGCAPVVKNSVWAHEPELHHPRIRQISFTNCSTVYLLCVSPDLETTWQVLRQKFWIATFTYLVSKALCFSTQLNVKCDSSFRSALSADAKHLNLRGAL